MVLFLLSLQDATITDPVLGTAGGPAGRLHSCSLHSAAAKNENTWSNMDLEAASKIQSEEAKTKGHVRKGSLAARAQVLGLQLYA